jgi:hypothetical protein
MLSVPPEILLDVIKNLERNEFERLQSINQQFRDVIQLNDSILSLRLLKLKSVEKHGTFVIGCPAYPDQHEHHLTPENYWIMKNCIFDKFVINIELNQKYMKMWEDIYKAIGQRVKVIEVRKSYLLRTPGTSCMIDQLVRDSYCTLWTG